MSMQNHVAFSGADRGDWRVESLRAVRGDPLPAVPYLDVAPASGSENQTSRPWVLRGFASNVRYAKRVEVTSLKAQSEPLGRSHAMKAALIPIRKTADWWALAQDERRAIFEEQSHHTAIGMDYLPAIARKLYHARDLGEPFDFLTWFEFAPEHEAAFEALVARLRATREWTYVDREIDIRLVRA